MASISSFGAAAILGIVALVAALAMFGGFAAGGYTSRGPRNEPAGVVHKGEWVAPKWMVDDPRYKATIAALESVREGRSVRSGGDMGEYNLGGLVDYITNPFHHGINNLKRPWDPANIWWSSYKKMLHRMDASGSQDGYADAAANGSMNLAMEADASAMRASSFAGLSAAESGSSTGSGRVGKQMMIALVDNRRIAEQMNRDPAVETLVVDIVKRNRAKLA
jgi:hypothetical protein